MHRLSIFGNKRPLHFKILAIEPMYLLFFFFGGWGVFNGHAMLQLDPSLHTLG